VCLRACACCLLGPTSERYASRSWCRYCDYDYDYYDDEHSHCENFTPQHAFTVHHTRAPLEHSPSPLFPVGAFARASQAGAAAVVCGAGARACAEVVSSIRTIGLLQFITSEARLFDMVYACSTTPDSMHPFITSALHCASHSEQLTETPSPVFRGLVAHCARTALQTRSLLLAKTKAAAGAGAGAGAEGRGERQSTWRRWRQETPDAGGGTGGIGGARAGYDGGDGGGSDEPPPPVMPETVRFVGGGSSDGCAHGFAEPSEGHLTNECDGGMLQLISRIFAPPYA
jgi:hypothetical protein